MSRVCPAVIIRLDTRISQRWKCSLFPRNICLLMSCQDVLWCHSPGRAIITTLCALPPVMWSHLWGPLWPARKWVYDKLKVWRLFFPCMTTCMCLSQYVNMDIWPERHGNGPQLSEMGSVSRVKVSTAAYWAFLDSWCHSSDVKKNASLCLQQSQINFRHLFCQFETKGIMMEIRVKASLRPCSLPSPSEQTWECS